MDLSLSGKVVAVTAASRGLGLAIAEALAAEGAHVAIAARNAGPLADAHGCIEAAGGGHCLAYACDLSEPGEAAAFVEACVETFGRLDGLVCMALATPPDEAPVSSRQAVLLANPLHAVEALEAAVPWLSAGRGAALFVAPAEADAGWHRAAARAALVETARALARDLAEHGVRVNALVPGIVASGQHHRAIAAIAAFLVSPLSAAINGAAIAAAGGSIIPADPA